jgi:5'-3' exonuclease
MSTIVAIDLAAVYWRHWHALAPTDAPDDAGRATVEQVRRVASRYDHAAVCLDSAGSWRKSIVPTYKAHREEKPVVAIAVLDRARETLALDGFAMLGAEGYEADDVIAGIVGWALAEEHEVVIATADKDLGQLVGDGVTWLRTDNGATLDAAGVRERYGVEPEQLGDWLALVGDASDNVPGVRGIGAKTAASMLAAYGSIAGIKAARLSGDERIKPKMAEALAAADEQLGISRVLVSLRAPDLDYSIAVAPRVTRPLPMTETTEEGDDMSDEVHEAEVIDEPQQPATQAPEARKSEPRGEPAPKAGGNGNGNGAPQLDGATRAAIVLAGPGSNAWNAALEPVTLNEAKRMSEVLYNSRLFGGYANEAAVFAAIVNGRSLGLPAIASLRGTHVIEGKLALSAATIIGLVLKSPLCLYLDCIESSATSCTWETQRKDRSPQRKTFTIEDAKTAGYIKPGGNWAKIPSTMLEWRTGVMLARRVYPDIVGGLYTPEELQDHSKEG